MEEVIIDTRVYEDNEPYPIDFRRIKAMRNDNHQLRPWDSDGHKTKDFEKTKLR